MTRKIPLLFALVWLSIPTLAQGVYGSRGKGMGGVAITLQDCWSSINNQAGLANVENVQIGIGYESFFGASSQSLAIALPTKSGGFGFSITNYGINQFAQSTMGLSYGMELGETINIGMQINYFQIRQEKFYGNQGWISSELGLQAKITQQLSMGARIINPAQIPTSDTQLIKQPSALILGAGYQFSNQVLVVAQVSKYQGYNAQVSGGIEYFLSDKIDLRAGLTTSTNINYRPTVLTTFGFGLNFKNLDFDMAVSSMQFIGFIPNMSLAFELNKETE